MVSPLFDYKLIIGEIYPGNNPFPESSLERFVKAILPAYTLLISILPCWHLSHNHIQPTQPKGLYPPTYPLQSIRCRYFLMHLIECLFKGFPCSDINGYNHSIPTIQFP